jgi:hypothetical protein
MKYLASLLCLLFVPLSVNAEQPERKVIKPPTTARPQSPQERRVVKPPTTVRPQLPQSFGRPIQRPPGFGKQEWQKPQPPQIQRNYNWNRGPVIIYNPYRYRYVHPHPVYQNWHHFYYQSQSVYPPYPVQPYFFFQFRW